MATRQTIVGFEFEVMDQGAGQATRWVRLQGSGGLMGDQCLHRLARSSTQAQDLSKTCAYLLICAQQEHARNDVLREFRGDDLPLEDRIVEIDPVVVCDCRPIVAAAE